jgi:hypothetical protein
VLASFAADALAGQISALRMSQASPTNAMMNMAEIRFSAMPFLINW